MTTTSLSIAVSPRSAATRVLRAGLLAGALDLCLATGLQLAFAGRADLVRVLHAVASGMLGRAAFAGAPGAAWLGLVLHFLIAGIWTGIWVAAAVRLAWLARLTATPKGRVVAGLAYGLVIWSGMHFVVVPLSRAPFGATWSWSTAAMIVGHMLMVGLPIALAVGAVGTDRGDSGG